jgi:hypothetical protein
MAWGAIRTEIDDPRFSFWGFFAKMQTAWRSLSAANADILTGQGCDEEGLGHIGAWGSLLEPQSVQ